MDTKLPVTRPDTSATQKTYVELRRMIVCGEIDPGEKLKIEGLRKRLHTGASPIREALSLLTSDNLVERMDQRGFRASPNRMVRAQRVGDAAFEDLHKAFHMSLLANCDAPILLKFCSQLYDLNIRYRYLAGHALNYKRRDVTKEHDEIMNAAILGDADAAARWLLSHYRETGAYLVDLLDDAALS